MRFRYAGFLLLAGILDKTGHIPLGGDDICFGLAACADWDSGEIPTKLSAISDNNRAAPA